MLKTDRLTATAPALAMFSAIFIVLANNRFFWNALFKTIDIATWNGFAFSLGVFVILVGIICALFLALSTRLLFKPMLIAILVLSAVVSYFQIEYSIIVDKSMIQNVFETDYKEATELVSFSLLWHLALFGLLPAVAVGFTRIRYHAFLKESVLRLLALLAAVLLAGFFVWANYKNFVLIGREHRELRMFINPTAPLFEAYKFGRDKLTQAADGRVEQIGLDARQNPQYLLAGHQDGKHNLVIMVVGETARAKSFSLNGYPRPTNPELAGDDVVSFSNAYSCGTSTAESVPCIFSHFGKDDYSSSSAGRYENTLDVLTHAGVKVLWRDNNSGCKGVCTRVETEDVSNLPVPALCNSEECYDEIMLHQLQQRIGKGSADTLVVLHQKGSHGPAYYKRYPKEFRRFTPECTDNAPQNCQQETLLNAYDNTILYTDHFLHQVIAFLKQHADQYNSVMLYASDHGESLGEKGIYLHGLPYMLAPDEQKHIPLIAWVSEGFTASHGLSRECLLKQQDQPYSHDNVTHSLLGLLGVETALYQADHDMFRACMGK